MSTEALISLTFTSFDSFRLKHKFPTPPSLLRVVYNCLLIVQVLLT